MQIVSQENLSLLESIIKNEEWNTAPDPNTFMNTLRSIQDNSMEEYKYLVDDLVKEVKQIPYSKLKETIELLIAESAIN